jgi:hypothetical protein
MSETENIFDRIIKELKREYWISIIVLAIYFLLILFDLIPYPFKGKEIGVTLERYAIVITIIAIPAALKLFAEMLKKVPPASSVDFVVKKYKSASNTRLYIIYAVTLMNILLYAISKNTNFFWFTIVLFIIYIFCKPSYPELANLADKGKVKEVHEEFDNGSFNEEFESEDEKDS